MLTLIYHVTDNVFKYIICIVFTFIKCTVFNHHIQMDNEQMQHCSTSLISIFCCVDLIRISDILPQITVMFVKVTTKFTNSVIDVLLFIQLMILRNMFIPH